ncbi:hypothetical protein HQ346_16920 [Rhodococcus sp. BP-252]|uniref:hypothetical protein n=1 Tax=unclassified Rhodococcus (in: high G+C Gram-positive bacteria) TaxID=192944 RepID=UPI001C9B08B3|nr:MULTISPECIES: hypothetical protein [unclassified Rhodococcus (in: high G+C Gram-positive bacteria)]MBY6413379.1 hypothetical protein [Rhodococcus sp. BP-320]MBY6418017.1 hypothetical protein [Rhodococcus sp. BP-321]MBY6422293.1 hypothetical protein [Rhodococcus sp. BP-324]MBY6428066.1 hypothetical protein [Rhodococcus sp. BP-323]MBY6433300.1 hypothetical protein [Rhodococcus sp. BP-322]
MRTETLESITMWYVRGVLAVVAVMFLSTLTTAVAVRVRTGSVEPGTVSVAAKTGIGVLVVGASVLVLEVLW